eukprot:483633_1
MSDFTVSGQLAVITGGADGIGKAIAIKLAMEGCNVAIIDINKNKLNETVTALKVLFPTIKIYGFECDMTDENAVKSLTYKIKSSFNTSTIQLLFNNIGMSELSHTILYGNIDKLKLVMNVNLWSMIYSTRTFLPLILANDLNQQCYIMNTGSIASVQEGFNWYAVTKHAVIVFSETIREELKRFHPKKYNQICVSTLVPAFVNTNIRKNSESLLGMSPSKNRTDQQKKHNKMIQMTRIDNVNEVGNIVYEALRSKKIVIPTHPNWHQAVVKDRMNALLNCKQNTKANMRRAVRARMAKYNQSKL